MKHEIDKEFGAYLRNLRVMRGLKLKELAEKSGYNMSHIGRIEQGNRRPNADYLLAVAPPLGVPQGFLLTQVGYKLDPPIEVTNAPDKPVNQLAHSLIQELMTDAVVEVSINGKHSMARIVKINFAR